MPRFTEFSMKTKTKRNCWELKMFEGHEKMTRW